MVATLLKWLTLPILASAIATTCLSADQQELGQLAKTENDTGLIRNSPKLRVYLND
ncbi:MAG: hypothetical protein ACI8PB_004319 [Desulforhopalus sp.]|jgi:hypothetical protein